MTNHIALGIALNARLYRLLADRPEFLTTDPAARLDAAWTNDAPGSLPLIDRVLISRADELDRLCGYAVAKLRHAAPAGVLDVLGILDPDRIVAIYFALPSRRRPSLLRDPAWSYHALRVDAQAVQEATAFWDDLPVLMVPADLPESDQLAYFRFLREAERCRLGLDHDLTPAQESCVLGHPPTPDKED